MNGPEHYREAERIAASVRSVDRRNEEGFTGWDPADLAALAQVHATLAHAAAVIDTGTGDVLEPKWYEVIQ